MYVLLAIFCAAIVVFVGTCVVYASRARKGMIPPEEEDANPPIDDDDEEGSPPSLWNAFKMRIQHQSKDLANRNGGSVGQRSDGQDPDEGADKGWIWLGRSTLDPEVPRQQQPTVEEENSRPVSQTANRLSGVSYAGSEISVRIVGRPGTDNGRLSYQAQLCFQPTLPDDIGVGTDGPGTTRSWSGSVDSKTFTKNGPPLRITDNHLSEESLLLSDVVVRRQPPGNNRRAARRSSEQDTRRYARSWLMAGEAVPRDFNSNPSTLGTEPEEEEEEIDNRNPELVNVGTFLRHGSPDIKQANIIENPRFSSIDSVDAENNSSRLVSSAAEEEPESVDYDRIISYLGILKETST